MKKPSVRSGIGFCSMAYLFPSVFLSDPISGVLISGFSKSTIVHSFVGFLGHCSYSSPRVFLLIILSVFFHWIFWFTHMNKKNQIDFTAIVFAWVYSWFPAFFLCISFFTFSLCASNRLLDIFLLFFFLVELSMLGRQDISKSKQWYMFEWLHS